MSQPDPKPGAVSVAPVVLATLETASRQHVDYLDMWPWLEKRIQTRIEAGRAKYGTPLETHNGRDALIDAWEESIDQVQYLTQEWLEGGSRGVGSVLADARKLLLKVSRLLWERETKEVLTGLEGGEHPQIVAVSTPGPGQNVYDQIQSAIDQYGSDNQAVESAFLFNQPVPPEVKDRLRNRWQPDYPDEWDNWRGASEPE